MAYAWNARRLSLYQLELLVGRVSDEGHWDYLFIQELALPHASDWVTQQQGIAVHRLIYNPLFTSDTAIIIHINGRRK